MKQEKFFIGNVPAILLGEQSERIFLFIHGQGGNKGEARAFADVVTSKGWQVFGIDLPEHGERNDGIKFLPWEVIPELRQVWEYAVSHWKHIALRANSIGAYFSMLAFQNVTLEQCLFVSPVLNMERLITDMMKREDITESELREKKVIKTNFGQTLLWEYLCYVREHSIAEWSVPTEILYADGDMMIPQETVEEFAEKNPCGLTVMKNGEHWFHTEEQLAFMRRWEERMLSGEKEESKTNRKRMEYSNKEESGGINNGI